MSSVNEVHKVIQAIMASNKEARKRNDYIKLIENGFAVLEYVSTLIEIKIDSEGKYRQLEASELDRLMDTKGRNGIAETNAKASQPYQDLLHATDLIELCYNMINIAKLLARGIDKELQATPNR